MQTYKEIKAVLLKCLENLGWDVRTLAKHSRKPLKIPHATKYQDHSGDTVRLFFKAQSIHVARYGGRLRAGQSDVDAGLTLRESHSCHSDIKDGWHFAEERMPGDIERPFQKWTENL